MSSRWTAVEDAYLREHWTARTHAEMAVALGRVHKGVRNRCWRLGLVDPEKQWTPEDVTTLRQWYEERDGKRLELATLAATLGRHKTNVCRKARELGLSKQSRPTGRKDRRKFKGDDAALRRSISKRTREHIATKGHPRGMLGKKHTPEAIRRMVASMDNWRALQSAETLSEIALRSVATRIKKYGTANPAVIGASNPYSRARRGRRNDLGETFFRSRWEANYARFLNFLQAQGQIQKWEFEPDTFWFEGIRRGVRSYTPDFKVWDRDGWIYYVEVKGWMDAKSKTKLKRMKKYHPEVDVRLFGEKAYRELERKLGAALPGWEAA